MFDALLSGLEDAWASAAAFTPKLVSAVIILVVGAFIARIVRTVVTKLLTRFAVDARLGTVLAKAGLPTGSISVTVLAGQLVWALVMVATVQAVAQTLGATALSLSLSVLLGYLPLMLVAAVILVGSVMLADFVGDLVLTSVGENAATAARLVRTAIVVLGAFLALGQLKVAPAIVNGLFYALLYGAVVAAVIAFGVGGIPVARTLLQEQVAKRRATTPVAPRVTV